MEAGVCTDTASYVVLHGGTEAQKHEWLPQFASGDVISEVGVTEPHSGSDPRSMKTHARRVGGDYVINGQKMWITNGPLMTTLVVAARTGEERDGRGSVSMFIVPIKGTKGVTVSKPLELMLKSAGGVAQVFFEDVRVPASSLLGGEEGRGMAAALDCITTARLAQAARMVAMCELAFVQTVEFTRNRRAFGQTVFDFQNTQFKLASVKTELSVARIYVDELLARNSREASHPWMPQWRSCGCRRWKDGCSMSCCSSMAVQASRTNTRSRRCTPSRECIVSISARRRSSA